MIDRFKNYCTKLEVLTDSELDRSAEKLVVEENTSIAKLIAHLAEMSERKTALRLGYSGLYDYCTRRLNLSEGAVPARVQVANVCRPFPQLLAALAERRLSLTVAGRLAAHVNEGNVEKLIAECAGKTSKETEEYLVALAPKDGFRPSIRKVPSPSKKPTAEVELRPKTGQSGRAEPPKTSPTILQPARPAVFNFRFSADKNFRDKFERLAEVLRVANPEKEMAAIIEKALDIALEKKDPKKKLERRLKRERAKENPSRSNQMAPQPSPNVATRNAPAATSERVHAKGDYQCEYRGPDATRCTSRIVELEHMRPFAREPNHDEASMRLLCRHHNRLEAERVYGQAHIERKIEESKKKRDSSVPVSSRVVSTAET